MLNILEAFVKLFASRMMVGKLIGLVIGCVFLGALVPTAITSIENANTTGWSTTQVAIWAVVGLVVLGGIIFMVLKETGMKGLIRFLYMRFMVGKLIGLVIGCVFLGALVPTAITSIENANTTGWSTTQVAVWAVVGLVVLGGIIFMVLKETGMKGLLRLIRY